MLWLQPPPVLCVTLPDRVPTGAALKLLLRPGVPPADGTTLRAGTAASSRSGHSRPERALRGGVCSLGCWRAAVSSRAVLRSQLSEDLVRIQALQFIPHPCYLGSGFFFFFFFLK